MTGYERLRYEMFLRVRDFGVAHRHRFAAASMADDAFRTVEAAVAEIEAVAADAMLASGHSSVRNAVRRALWDRLTAIAPTARLIARSRPSVGAAFRFCHQPADGVLVAASRAFLRDAPAVLDRFVEAGMRTSFLDELRASVDRFEQALAHQRAGRSRMAERRARLDTALARGLDAVLALDVIVANTLGSDPVTLAAWRHGRRMNRKAHTRPSRGAAPENDSTTR